MRAAMIGAAAVAALVGFGSTVALVLAAASAVGATPAEAASWVLAVSLAKAAGSAALSAWARAPVLLAWSTPGAALVAASEGVSMAEAAGAFVLAGLGVAALGIVRPLGALVARIPDAVAAGMLAGVLLPFCLRLAPAAADLPALVGPAVAAFALARLWTPSGAVLAALALGLALAYGGGWAAAPGAPGEALALPALAFVAPDFDAGTAVGLALPLLLVTMAGQNLPGFATMRAAGFEPPVGAALTATGLLSAVAGLFGGHTVSMAAITAAICLGPDVDPDARTRWRVGLAYGAMWVALGLASPFAIAALAGLPEPLVAGIVGVALLTPLLGALAGAMAAPAARLPAAATLVVTASGVAAFGIGAAFWGLAVGVALALLDRAVTRARPSGSP